MKMNKNLEPQFYEVNQSCETWWASTGLERLRKIGVLCFWVKNG